MYIYMFPIGYSLWARAGTMGTPPSWGPGPPAAGPGRGGAVRPQGPHQWGLGPPAEAILGEGRGRYELECDIHKVLDKQKEYRILDKA